MQPEDSKSQLAFYEFVNLFPRGFSLGKAP